jgi:hypothetical protein
VTRLSPDALPVRSGLGGKATCRLCGMDFVAANLVAMGVHLLVSHPDALIQSEFFQGKLCELQKTLYDAAYEFGQRLKEDLK